MPKTTALGWGAAGTNASEGVPSPGISSSKSSKSKKASEPKEPTSHRVPARTAALRLRKGLQGGSTVRSTAGLEKTEDQDQA